MVQQQVKTESICHLNFGGQAESLVCNSWFSSTAQVLASQAYPPCPPHPNICKNQSSSSAVVLPRYHCIYRCLSPVSTVTVTTQRNCTYVTFCLKWPYAVKDHIQTTRKQASIPRRPCHCVRFSTSCHTVCKQKTYSVATTRSYSLKFHITFHCI